MLTVNVLAQSKSTIEQEDDIASYYSLLEQIKSLPIERKIEAIETYMQNHPQSTFKQDLQDNLTTLNDLYFETNPKKKDEKKDTDLYLKAVSYSKKLTLQDQAQMWKQFLNENPNTLYKEEIYTRLSLLQSRLPTEPKKTTKQQIKKNQELSVAPSLDFKDPNKAFLLATFPGLVVPGLGHFYAKDYIMGGVLAALRVGGLAVGIPGIINRDNPSILVASILAGFSYLADVANAPFATRKYNDRLEASHLRSSTLRNQTLPPGMMFVWTKSF